MLEGRSHDQVAPAAEDAGGLRAADRLAAGKDDEVGALGDEAPEVRLGRQFRRRVDDHRHAGGVGDRHDVARAAGARRRLAT